MHDFREERFYKMYIIMFIVRHFSTNARAKKILTMRKIELLYFIIKNPIKLKSTLENLGLGSLSNYKPLLYDSSIVAEDFDSPDNIRESVIYLLELGKIKSATIEGTRYFYSELIEEIQAPNETIRSNLKKITKIASLSEAKLTKSIIGL
ncbi:hypothetical protein BCT41_15280 [Vibrio splendidus]|uniref:hypothetical protein n=1 Tax=Vibrio splendidus TaxID=29497 RepID=UPI000C82AE00|nr:hypothetical protein [Vibrio splendidus]PMM13506.1 hypothetical protein BCT62_25455 [Vibrio splendidus]PMM96812.1 hypothetical protein BCT41_15280 [Vibrio splendidus]